MTKRGALDPNKVAPTPLHPSPTNRGIEYVNHVFLPPELRQKNDSDDTKSPSLIKELLAALRSLQALVPEQERSEWTPCIKMVGNMLELRDHLGGLAVEKVQITLGKMIYGGTNESAFGDGTGL